MKVLIVDDNPINRKLLKVTLENEGFQTFEAEDGVAALDGLREMAGTGEEKAGVIISDILMPRMDGYRLCREVRKSSQLEHIPFIFYTSTYTSSGDEKLALDCGADRYIRKPAAPGTVLEAIRALTGQRPRRRHPAAMPEELLVMREYNAALVRKLEERNAKLEQAREEIMRVNEGLERRVRERTAQLVLANQELEAFSYSIAHDLRSPLMAIDGFGAILLKECAGRVAPTSIEYLHYICKAARRMNELTNDLLRLARASRSEIRRDTIDLSILARGILQDLRELYPEREVREKVAEGMVANGDLALLRIALENLINNAWKFTGKTPGAEIEVGMVRTNRGRDYFVRDNGAGFDMATAGKLFGTFERLHSTSDFPGTGIGLATVQRIVRRHGGSIRAESAPGRGATFSFDLGPSDREGGR